MTISFIDKRLESINEKVENKTRLSREDGILLFETSDLTGVGMLADKVRRTLHGNKAFYVYNQHLNYTNICKNRCLFCAFSVDKEDENAYCWSKNDIEKWIYDRIDEPVNEIHIVGGLNPELEFDYFTDLLKTVKKVRPEAIIKAFTCVEIDYLSRLSGFSVEKTIKILMDAGLDMMPGGGAEVMSERVRQKLFPKKTGSKRWLEIMEAVHRAGLTSNATMLYGHIETIAERVQHLINLRELQDRTHGFSAFIPLAFNSENTKLSYLPPTTAVDDLKNIAVARLMLDNFPHIKAYWVMIGEKLAQVALSYGADDLDGTILEERITHTAGAKSAKGHTRKSLEEMIASAGFIPTERDSFYNIINYKTDQKANYAKDHKRCPELYEKIDIKADDEISSKIDGKINYSQYSNSDARINNGINKSTFGNKSNKSNKINKIKKSDGIINKISEKIYQKQRITPEEALVLYHNADFLTLARMAEKRRFDIHPERIVSFVIDRNINYTNICVSGCRFCAFFATPGSKKGYVISRKALKQKIQETLDLKGTQILLQGGMNPDLDLDYYIDLLKFIKDNFDIHIHGFSPPEINFIAEKSSLTIKETIKILKNAGLDSIPGGGAEILCDEIRKKVSPGKCMTEQWLEVMRQAHKQGMRSSATMMFGHIEETHHIFEHMKRIRELQDETKGFTAFIPWTFQPDNTRIKVKKTQAVEYLRVLAISRLFFDNIDNIQASWVTQGDKIGQAALFFGANDMGSTMIEENVVASAGVEFMLSEKELRRLISEAGFKPEQRDCFYNIV